MVTILISAAFRRAVLIRGDVLINEERLFQHGHPKERSLLEGGACLKLGAY